MKVLIAEDSPSTRLYLVKIFEEYGHTVFSVENGLDAWEKLKNEKIDILITDWMMPEMDGITLCKKIRSHARFKYNYIYIIFLTSKNGKNDLIEVFASGADDYIKKPFDHAELLARIKTAERITELEKRHGRDKEDLLRRSEVIDKRVRELNCLYSVSDLVNTPGITPNEILKKSIELIHPSLHGPVTSHIRITTEDTLYETDGFNPFGCKLEQNLYVHGKTFGTIEIYHPDCFTEEERKLVKTLSNRLGSALEKISIEQKVKDDERRYRNILENIEEGYFEVDLAGNFKFVNDSMCKILGYTKDELKGMNYSQITSEEQSRQAYTVFNDVFTTEKPRLSYRQDIIRKDDTLKYIEISASILKNGNGEKTGFRGMIRDITDHREYEEKLKFFKDLIDQSNDAISVLDPQTDRYIYVNLKACEIYGYEREEFFSMEPLDLDVTLTGDKKNSFIEELMINKTLLFETTNRKKDGTLIPLEISAKLIYQGDRLFHLIVARDISDRRLAEKEKKNYEAQLIQSEKMASIGQLAAGVAHEINNPTGFISSNIKTLGEYQNDMCMLIEEYRKHLKNLKDHYKDTEQFPFQEEFNRIAEMEKELDIDYILADSSDLIRESHNGTERIKKIVSDLKNYAHPGEDKMKYADINKNLESTLNVVWNELKYKAEVIRDYQDIPLVECFPQQLNQVFGNILVNAAQAIEKNGRISIATRNEEENVVITITDNGEGIPDENLPRIFDPFFTTKEVGKGTGLGLNVAYNIIKKHNGRIEIKSRVGEGTAFIITIPCSFSASTGKRE